MVGVAEGGVVVVVVLGAVVSTSPKSRENTSSVAPPVLLLVSWSLNMGVVGNTEAAEDEEAEEHAMYSGVNSSLNNGMLICTLEPLRCRIFAVNVPNRGWGFMQPSGE